MCTFKENPWILRWPGRDIDFFFHPRVYFFFIRDDPRLLFLPHVWRLQAHVHWRAGLRSRGAAAIAGEDRWFHGCRRHLGCGANTAKSTVNVWEKSYFWCSITRGKFFLSATSFFAYVCYDCGLTYTEEQAWDREQATWQQFHGRRRRLGCGANTAKVTVNVMEKSWFWCSITWGRLTFYNFYKLKTKNTS